MLPADGSLVGVSGLHCVLRRTKNGVVLAMGIKLCGPIRVDGLPGLADGPSSEIVRRHRVGGRGRHDEKFGDAVADRVCHLVESGAGLCRATHGNNTRTFEAIHKGLVKC